MSLKKAARGALLGTAFLMSAISLPITADDDDDEDAGPSRFVTYEGRPAIRLEGDMQEKAAIRTARLESRSLLHEVRVTGEVVDVTPLLEQRARYLELQSEKERLTAAVEISSATVERLTTLQSMDSNISTRELQAAQLQYRQEKIRLKGLNRQLDNLQNIMRREWGSVLADRAMTPDSSELSEIADAQTMLILVESPFDTAPDTIYIGDSNERARAREARYVSPAARAAANLRGNTHYYQASPGKLRTGMRLYSWIPDPEHEINGVMLPVNAIIWFNGRPWFYTRHDGNIFVKNRAGEHMVTGEGWLLRDESLAGAEVVTGGSQMLLSEEYRVQIPDEDDL